MGAPIFKDLPTWTPDEIRDNMCVGDYVIADWQFPDGQADLVNAMFVVTGINPPSAVHRNGFEARLVTFVPSPLLVFRFTTEQVKVLFKAVAERVH